MRQLTFIDWFAGVGGFRRGMELAGHKCVGFCEYDKFATASYVSMHLLTDEQRERLGALDLKQRQKEILKEGYKNHEWYARDIRTVNVSDIPRADVWCFGFPCQDISVAGKQRGFEGNRSSLFFRVMYLVGQIREEERPNYLFIENVRNLFSVNGGWDFARLLVELDGGGYDAEWQIINSKDYGVPQNRERVFIIGHSRNKRTAKVFPISGSTAKNSAAIKQVGEAISTRKNPNQYRAYEVNGIAPTLNSMGGGGREPHIIADVNVVGGIGQKKSNNGKQWFQQDRVYNGEGIATSVAANLPGGANMYAIPVLTPDRENKRQAGRRMKEPGDPAFTVTAEDRHGVAVSLNQGNTEGVPVIWYDKRKCYIAIRKLTPKECWRLQGWTDDYFERAQFVNSDSQLYKQAGNGVTVTVIQAIAERLGNDD